MPKIVISHAVTDIETWLKGKAERVHLFAPFATNVVDHVAMDGSKNVAITADVHDMEKAQATIASPTPETEDAMKRHGVVPPVSVHVEK